MVRRLATIASQLAQEQGTFKASEFRDATNLNRRTAIQVLEYFGAALLTRRKAPCIETSEGRHRPSFAVRITPASDACAEAIARELRELPAPVVGRIHADAVWLDCRGLEEEGVILRAFAIATGG